MEKNSNNGEISPIVKAIRGAYQRGQEDEALEPIVAVDSSGQPKGRFDDGNYVIFYDIRGEREIQLTESLISKDFNHFSVKRDMRLNFVTMIEYDSRLKVKVAFPPDGKIKNSLGEVVSKAGFRLLKIAESEKAVHVGFFMNGKMEESYPGEERIVVPSPEDLSSYALRPEMNASQVAREVSSSLKNPSYQVIVANLANVDVVGHEEDRKAVLRAVETVDSELGRIMDDCRTQGVALIVTSDHGTVEEWIYPDGTINTGHTKNPVPFILHPAHRSLRSYHPHPKTLADPPHLSADAAIAHDAQRRVSELLTNEESPTPLGPFPPILVVQHFGHTATPGHHGGEGVLGDGGDVDTAAGGDEDMASHDGLAQQVIRSSAMQL